VKRLVALAAIALLAACSGNFSTGTNMPQPGGEVPPVGATQMPQTDKNGLPTQATPSASPGLSSTASYTIDEAQKGFACPQLGDGYACTLSFNLPPPTPAPSPSTSPSRKGAKSKTKASPKPTPSPTPTPAPTPTPDPNPSASSGASPKPTPTPATITLLAQATPKDAPKMVHIPANTLDTVALAMVQLTTNGDFPLDGWANAQFTLPKSQIDGRGFALQLFQVNKHKKGVDYKPIWTFDKSTLNDTTLTFEFQPPKMTIAKGSTYMLVLYGDDKSTAAGSPPASPSGSPSASPSASPSPAASPGD
jgi:hypothetical protein